MWIAGRREADGLGRHTSQLRSVELVIEEAVGQIRKEIEAISPTASMAETYEACRLADSHLVWLRRFWDYFRSKWDQRDDPTLSPLLGAADELIWSCYVVPFRSIGCPERPVPISYLDAELSPFAIARSRVPPALRPADELLRSAVAELPVPVIGVPRAWLLSPWWLVLLAHEVGHQVAADLADQDGLLAGGSRLSAALSERLGRNESEWDGWVDEIFADAFALAMVGSTHLLALIEFEHCADAAMLRRYRGYPPPLVRHTLAAGLLVELGLPRADAIPTVSELPALEDLNLASATREYAARLLEAVPVLVSLLSEQPLLGDATLADLTAFDVAQLSSSGLAGWWARQFAGENPLTPQSSPSAPRLAAIGALAEWSRIHTEESDDERRSERLAGLRNGVIDVISRSHEEGRRDLPSPPPIERQDARTLAERVTRLPAHEVEPAPTELPEIAAGL